MTHSSSFDFGQLWSPPKLEALDSFTDDLFKEFHIKSFPRHEDLTKPIKDKHLETYSEPLQVSQCSFDTDKETTTAAECQEDKQSEHMSEDTPSTVHDTESCPEQNHDHPGDLDATATSQVDHHHHHEAEVAQLNVSEQMVSDTITESPRTSTTDVDATPMMADRCITPALPSSQCDHVQTSQASPASPSMNLLRKTSAFLRQRMLIKSATDSTHATQPTRTAMHESAHRRSLPSASLKSPANAKMRPQSAFPTSPTKRRTLLGFFTTKH